MERGGGLINSIFELLNCYASSHMYANLTAPKIALESRSKYKLKQPSNSNK